MEQEFLKEEDMLLIYKNAFARRDIIAKKYEEFAKDETNSL